MTCIVAAVLGDGRRCVVTDGLVTIGDRILTTNHDKRVQGPGFVLGVSGMMSILPFLDLALKECRGDWSQISVAHMVNASCRSAHFGEEDWSAVGFLGSKLTYMCGKGDPSFLDLPYYACGSGALAATGFLAAKPSHELTELDLKQAVEVACNLTTSCGGKIQVTYDH